MKIRLLTDSLMLVGSAALPSLLLTSTLATASESPAPATAEGAIPQSVFQMPGPGFTGRDPFYPNSTRIMHDITPVVANTPPSGKLVLKGISGTIDRPLAMINGVTFEVGEEREVRTGAVRVRVRLMSVDAQGLKVTIAVGNETRELRLREEEENSAKIRQPTEAETAQLLAPGRI